MMNMRNGLDREKSVEKALVFFCVVLMPCGLLLVYFKLMFLGLINYSSMDFAQLGRNLSDGRGFSTNFLRPLALVHGGNPVNQPDLVRGPLYPIILALNFLTFGPKDWVVALSSGFFYVATSPLIYLLGRRVFSHRVGLCASIVYSVNSLFLEYAISGLHITLYAFLITAVFYTLFIIHEKTETEGSAPSVYIVMLGLIAGFLYLVDSLFIWSCFVLLMLILTSQKKRRMNAFFVFMTTFILVCAPWMIRNAILTGNPVFGLRGIEVWGGTKGYYPGSKAYRMLPDDLTRSVGLFKAVAKKIMLGTGIVVQAFPQVSASWMLAFLLPSLLFRYSVNTINRLRFATMQVFLGILIGTLLFGVEMPYFVGLIPIMLILSVSYIFHLIDEVGISRRGRVAVGSIFAFVIMLPVFSDVFLDEKPLVSPDRGAARLLMKNTGPKDVVLSDSPWLVAWYGNRPCIWIPVVDGNIREFHKQFSGLKFVFLTEGVRNESPDWQVLYTTFRQWNEQCAQADLAGSAHPQPLRISGSLFPLLSILDGYVSVDRQKEMAPTTVLLAKP